MKSPLTVFQSVLFGWLTFSIVSSVMAQDEAQTGAYSTFYGGVHGPIPNVELPPNVPAPFDKLTLYADFEAKDAQGVPIFLVNRTDHPVIFDSQDGDIYLKLEHLLPNEKWERAQTHTPSDCGNSYGGITLKPSQHFRLHGYMPTNGVRGKVRYAKPSDASLISNEGDGFVLEKDIQAAKVDSMSRTAPRRIAMSLDPAFRLPPDKVLVPAERVAAMRLLQVLGANIYYKQAAQKWAHEMKMNTASTPEETQAADTIEKLAEAPWPTDQDSTALLDRCVKALQNQGATQTEYGMPEQQPALVWSILADLGERDLARYRSRNQNHVVNFESWKTVMSLVQDAIVSHDESIARSVATIVAVAPLSDELLPNAFFEKHLWDNDGYVQKVCANTLSRRGDRQTLVSIAWKLPPEAQLMVLRALAYPVDDLQYGNAISHGYGGGGEEKFWTYCMETMPMKSTYVLESGQSAEYNAFDRIVHDPLHDFFAQEAKRSDERKEEFKLDDYEMRMAVEFLDTWHLDEDTPVLQSLLSYKGYQLQEGSRSDSMSSNVMKPFVTQIFSVRGAAKAALLKRGVPVPTNLVLEKDVTP